MLIYSVSDCYNNTMDARIVIQGSYTSVRLTPLDTFGRFLITVEAAL